jgi:hypothetical protein
MIFWPVGQCAKMRNRMKFIVSLYRDEDGTYIAECPSIPGCVSQGQTETEAESNITDAIRECWRCGRNSACHRP